MAGRVRRRERVGMNNKIVNHSLKRMSSLHEAAHWWRQCMAWKQSYRRTSHFFETYERTICVDIRSRRTIFRYAGRTSKRNNTSWWEGRLAELRICKLKAIEI